MSSVRPIRARDRCVLGPGDFARGAVDLDCAHQRRRIPCFEQRFGHQQVSAATGMHAIRNQFLRACRIDLIRAFQGFGTTEVFKSATFACSFSANSFRNCRSAQERIVSTFEARRAGDIIVGARLNQSRRACGNAVFIDFTR